MNKKAPSAKKSLIVSIFALVLCVSMLIGTTYAWFTESIGSGINTIKSGNLDVELEYYNGSDWKPVSGATEIFDPAALWEPGYTEVVYLRISNLGSLALKYQLSINVVNEVSSVNVEGESFNLSDYIYYGAGQSEEFSQINSRDEALARVASPTRIKNGYKTPNTPLAEGECAYITLVVYMPTTVGNEANYRQGAIPPSIELGINLVATQQTADVEKDSFDNTYDENAPYILPLGVTAASFGDMNVAISGSDGIVRYFTDLKGAIEALHADKEAGASAGDKVDAIYCKPGADLGSVTHLHVCESLTVYGNDAYISGGEADFEVDTYKQCHSSSKTCAGVTEEITLTINSLDGVAVWGQRTSEQTVNIVLNDCEDISRLYISGTSGVTNVTIKDSSYDGTNGYSDTGVYTNNPGTINIVNTTFKAYAIPINQNNKSIGTQNIILKNCEFIDCATASTVNAESVKYAAPVRVVATEYASAVSNLTLDGCKFTYHGDNAPVDVNILTLDKRAGKLNNGTVNVVIDGREVCTDVATANEKLARGESVTLTECNEPSATIIVPDGMSITLIDVKAANLVGVGDATVIIKGKVQFISAADTPAVSAAGNLIIEGDGELTAIGGGAQDSTAGTGASGITAKNITINGLSRVVAEGYGYHAFGIGGDATESITVKNTTVKYVKGGYVQPNLIYDTSYGKSEPEGGAAIGSGYKGAVITIDNSTVDLARGGSKAAAIGAMFHTGVTINITDSKINRAEGGNASAGIGGSRMGKDPGSSEDIVINIARSTVNAKGGEFGAGIGLGYDTHCQTPDKAAKCTITITDNSVITAEGGKYGAGIGTGYHTARLYGSIDSTVTVNATGGAAREKYTVPMAVGFGVIDVSREANSSNDSSFDYNGIIITVASAPAVN